LRDRQGRHDDRTARQPTGVEPTKGSRRRPSRWDSVKPWRRVLVAAREPKRGRGALPCKTYLPLSALPHSRAPVRHRSSLARYPYNWCVSERTERRWEQKVQISAHLHTTLPSSVRPRAPEGQGAKQRLATGHFIL